MRQTVMAHDEDLARVQLTIGDLLQAFTALIHSHNALLDALKELLPGFPEAHQKHLYIRSSDKADVADAGELERAQTALRDELERVRNLRKNS
jgi:hypothetical protein